MKKCPYCAEEIQDEAIVCRYCGRDLVPVVNPPVATPQPEKAASVQVSAWTQGAKASAVITVLYFINNAFIKTSDNFQGNIVFGLLSTFIGWWLICTFLVWLWRILGNSTFEKIALLLFIGIVVYFIGWVVSGSNIQLLAPTPTPTRTPRPTPRPTRTPVLIGFMADLATVQAQHSTQEALAPANCISWEQVDESFAGQTICVYGIVYEAKVTNIGDGQFRIYFSRNADAFFLLDVNYVYSDVKPGSCVSAEGVVETDGRNVTFINLKGNLYNCVP